MTRAKAPARGEIWLAELDPTRGREQAGRRPVLVTSDDIYNQGPTELIVSLPITSTLRGVPIHIRIRPPEGGLRTESVVLCDQIRCLAQERFVHRIGQVSEATMMLVEDSLRALLRL